MPKRLIRLTYHIASKQLQTHLIVTHNEWLFVRNAIIENNMTQGLHLPQSDIRVYWIDADFDEIDIVNQNDYEIFLIKCEKKMHLNVAIDESVSVDNDRFYHLYGNETLVLESGNVPNTFGSPEVNAKNFIHRGIVCDGCDLRPIIGFRYKCIQCFNYDLCQDCETKQKHPDHAMVRVPNIDASSVKISRSKEFTSVLSFNDLC